MKPIAFEHVNRTLNPPQPHASLELPDEAPEWSEESIARFKAAWEARYRGPAPYPENVTGIDLLYVWTDGEQCVSCWKMSWRERLSALLVGHVWLNVLGGQTQSPVYLQVSRQYLEVSGPNCRCYLRGWTLLGLFNTVIGCVFNRVLAKIMDMETGKTLSWFWGKGTDFPPAAK